MSQFKTAIAHHSPSGVCGAITRASAISAGYPGLHVGSKDDLPIEPGDRATYIQIEDPVAQIFRSPVYRLLGAEEHDEQPGQCSMDVTQMRLEIAHV